MSLLSSRTRRIMEDDSESEREGGREGESDEMKSWEIRGTRRAHMAVDMVELDCEL